MAQNDPWAEFLPSGPAAPSAPVQQRRPDPIVKPADPYRQAAEQRAAADQQMQVQKFQWEQERAQRTDARQERTDAAGTESERTAGFLTKRIVDAVQRMQGAIKTDPDAARPTIPVEVTRNLIGDTAANYMTDAERQQVRAAEIDILDAALTLGTGAAYTREQLEGYRESYFPKLGDDEATVASKKQALRSLLVSAQIKAGRSAPDIEAAIAALDGNVRNDIPAGQPPIQNAPSGPSAPQPPVFDGPGGVQRVTGSTRRVADPQVSAELDAMIRSGASYQDMNAYAQSKGLQAVDPREYAAVKSFLKKNPGYKGRLVDAWKDEPVSAFEQGITNIGDNPVGAYFMGAGQMLSGNTLDNLAADPERARAALGIVSGANPTAFTAGEVSGGVLASLGGEAALARLGAAPGFLRSFAADAGVGAANAAGSADAPNESRGMNALFGAAISGAGSAIGSGLTRGISRTIAPEARDINKLYESGVRPTPGQRFVNRGVMGRILNNTEEALQSVPIVGAAISGARQEARDQFQIGAFNEALREVGEQIPKGMGPGTAPQAYAQKTFDRVYAEARSGMTLQADEELAQDLAGIDQFVSTLAEPSAKRFNAVFKNVVGRRAENGGGQIDGKAYKDMISDLGKQIRSIRDNPNGDYELAEALDELKSVLDNAARRHSDPDAVALLDAADAGYAKLVRIEDAARRAGGDAGTFTPAQFDRSVQKMSGGTRSKAYLRGDALMQDYAEQGKNLVDRIPNSGSIDRGLAATTIAGGATYLSPAIGAFLATVGAAYSPLARKALKGAIAPRGPKSKVIAAQLKKRAALVGKATAATGVAALPGTSPSQ